MGTPNEGINGTLATGLLAHWCFDGDLLDSSGNEYDILGTGGIFIDDSKGVKKRLNFNGDSGLYIPSPTGMYTNEISISLFFTPQLNYNKEFLSYGISGGNMGFQIYELNDTVWRIYCMSYTIDIPSLIAGKEYNLIITFKESVFSVYLDNVLINSISGISLTYASHIYFGNYSGGFFSTSYIDEMRVYNREITPAEREEIQVMGVNYAAATVPATPNEGINGTLGDGLIGHWDFTDGRLLDVSGNGRDLSQIGSITNIPDKDGIINSAVSFVGSNNKLVANYSENIINPTISAWINPSIVVGGSEAIAVIKGLGDNWQGFGIYTTDPYGIKIGTYIGQELANLYTLDPSYYDGNWHHVVAFYDRVNKKLKLFVDKILKMIYSTQDENITYNATNEIVFGSTSTFDFGYERYLDEVRIYSRTLTDGGANTVGDMATGEIAELYDMGVNYTPPPPEPIVPPPSTPNEGINGTLGDGLIGHWDFTDGRLLDVSGNNKTITKSGNTSFGRDKDGNLNSALDFLDVNSYASVQINFQTLMTFSIWFYCYDAIDRGLMAMSNNVSNPAFIYTNALTTKKIYAFDGSQKNVSFTPALASWNHIVGTFESGGTLSLYHNGVFIGNINVGVLYSNVSYIVFGVGNNANSVQSFQNKIDEVRVYNRILTGKPTNIGETATGEIAELYTMGVNYTFPKPVFLTTEISNITENAIYLRVMTDIESILSYKLILSNEQNPTPQELVSSSDRRIDLPQGDPSVIIIDTTSNTSYKLCFIAESVETEILQDEITVIEFVSLPENGVPNNGTSGTLGEDLIAHYSFKDGKFLDYSGNNHNLTKLGQYSSTHMSIIKDKDGNENCAISIDENNINLEGLAGTRLETSVSSELKTEIIHNSFTVSMWVKKHVLQLTGETLFSIFADYDTETELRSGFSLGIWGYSPSLWIYYTPAEEINYTNYGIESPNLQDGNWHNIVASYDIVSGKVKIFLDKVLVIYKSSSQLQVSNWHTASNNLIQIGVTNQYPHICNNSIDEVRLYKRILTDGNTNTLSDVATGEIEEIYNMGVNLNTNINFSKAEISNITQTSAKLTIEADADAILYYKTIESSQSLTEDIDGTISILQNSPSIINIENLQPETSYKTYILAENNLAYSDLIEIQFITDYNSNIYVEKEMQNSQFVNIQSGEVRITTFAQDIDGKVSIFSVPFSITNGGIKVNLDTILGRNREKNDLFQRGKFASSTTGNEIIIDKTNSIIIKDDYSYIYNNINSNSTTRSKSMIKQFISGESFNSNNLDYKIVGTNGIIKTEESTLSKKSFALLTALDGMLIEPQMSIIDAGKGIFDILKSNVKVIPYNKTTALIMFELLTTYDENKAEGYRFVYTINSNVKLSEQTDANEISFDQMTLCDVRYINKFFYQGLSYGEYGQNVPTRQIKIGRNIQNIFKSNIDLNNIVNGIISSNNIEIPLYTITTKSELIDYLPQNNDICVGFLNNKYSCFKYVGDNQWMMIENNVTNDINNNSTTTTNQNGLYDIYDFNFELGDFSII